jgi:hypothetical protein
MHKQKGVVFFALLIGLFMGGAMGVGITQHLDGTDGMMLPEKSDDPVSRVIERNYSNDVTA